nr:uncharacterized protein c14c4.04 [Quercus suber]
MLGATQAAVSAYNAVTQTPAWQKPLSWTDSSFSLRDFDLVFLPGGHDKPVRQLLDNARLHSQLAEFFPLTKHNGTDKKVCAAICHGVQLLAHAKDADARSILHSVSTTALPGAFENAAYQGTRLWMGDYYKTYGAGSANVEDVVKACLDDPAKQWKGSVNPAQPWVVEDENHAYLSARWPGDAQLLGEKVVEAVKKAKGL